MDGSKRVARCDRGGPFVVSVSERGSPSVVMNMSISMTVRHVLCAEADSARAIKEREIFVMQEFSATCSMYVCMRACGESSLRYLGINDLSYY